MSHTQPRSTPMVRLALDVPASVPLTALHAFARAQNCILTRTPDGVYRLQPDRRSPRHQRGFTLIELATVSAVIAILATIAIPSMMSTLMRQSVQKGIEYTEPLQALVIENHADGLPLDSGFTTMQAPMKRLEQISIDGTSGTITLEWRHGTVVVEPINLGDPLVAWRCTAGTLDEKFRPSACREG